MAGEQLKGNIELLVLSVLAHEPRHGYAIIHELRERSQGAFDLAEGTVYPALHRMERDGLVQSHWFAFGGRRRRMYEPTAAGTRALAAQRSSWAQFADGMKAVLGAHAPAPA